MKRKPPPAPPEMPARLRGFHPADWVQPGDPAGDDGQRIARERWNQAGLAWGREHGVSPLDILRERVQNRRNAAREGQR